MVLTLDLVLVDDTTVDCCKLFAKKELKPRKND